MPKMSLSLTSETIAIDDFIKSLGQKCKLHCVMNAEKLEQFGSKHVLLSKKEFFKGAIGLNVKGLVCDVNEVLIRVFGFLIAHFFLR